MTELTKGRIGPDYAHDVTTGILCETLCTLSIETGPKMTTNNRADVLTNKMNRARRCADKRKRKRTAANRHHCSFVMPELLDAAHEVEPKAHTGASGSRYTVHI